MATITRTKWVGAVSQSNDKEVPAAGEKATINSMMDKE